jgi:hypothetical protein
MEAERIELGPDELLELLQELVDGTAPLEEELYEQLITELAHVYCKVTGCWVEAVYTEDGVQVVLAGPEPLQ